MLVRDMELVMVTGFLANAHASHHCPHCQTARRTVVGLANAILAPMPDMATLVGRRIAMKHQGVVRGSRAMGRLDGAQHPFVLWLRLCSFTRGCIAKIPWNTRWRACPEP